MTLFQTLILAGGLATRLHPLTITQPKSLLPVRGEPFISHQLQLLKQNHCTHVVLCLGHLGEQIIEYVGDGQRYGLNISYVFDGPQLLGTGGAIKKALPLMNGPFFVLYGDSYLPCPYLAIQKKYQQQKKPALMTVFRNLGQWDTSNVEYADGQILKYDKKNRTERMQYIDYGLGLLDPACFDTVPEDVPYDLALLYQQLLEKNQLAAYEVSERFYEVGSFAGIQELEQFLME